MNHGNWKEMSSHPTNIANCTPHADKRLHGVHLARYVKSALELERCVVSAALKVILSHKIQQQRQQQHNSAIPPPQHPWGRFAHFGAKISGMFQNMRQIKNKPPVYHMQSWKQKWMREGKNRKKTKTENDPSEDYTSRRLNQSIQCWFGWIYPPLERLLELTLRPLHDVYGWRGGKISHFKCF